MDKRLFQRLKKIENQIERLYDVEKEYLYLEAHKKIMISSLFLKAPGKSVAEKEAQAHDSKDWKDFVAGLSEKEAEYLREKRLLELKLKAYDAEHLTFKNEVPAIVRQK